MMRSSLLAVALVSFVSLALPRAGGAQTRFDAVGFHPPTTGQGYLAVDGAFVLPHLSWQVGIFASYAHDPLVLRTADGAIPPGGRLIEHQLSMDLVGSFAFFERFELGVGLPFVPYQGTDATFLAPGTAPASAGLGDLRLDLKMLVLLFRPAKGHRIGVAAIVGGSAPTGDASSFLGQDGFTGRPRLVAEWRHRRASVAVSLGAVLRSRRQLGDLYVTNQVSYGAAARIAVWRALEVVGEVSGLVGVGLPKVASQGLTTSEAPAELLAGLRYRTAFGLELSAAGGTGLGGGYGSPDGRLMVGARYLAPERKAPPPVRDPDRDGDGVIDVRDRCPSEVGAADAGGCPDQDGDGLADDQDRCTDVAGPAVNQGCPDQDRDGDGFIDRLDSCPEVPGIASEGGCPVADRDQDGVADRVDRCVDRRGPATNQGCPDFDTDRDGFVDRRDRCPDQAEVYNGVEDADGCPDEGQALVALTRDKIVLIDPVVFGAHDAKLDPRSFKVLGVVAGILERHPQLVLLRIDGYTEERGRALANLELSRDRAVAVRRHLIEVHGIAAERLSAKGFGTGAPIPVKGKGKAKARPNGRIELTILERED